jgi:hypothetical protein
MGSIRYNEAEVAEYLRRFYGKTESKDHSAVSPADAKPAGRNVVTKSAAVKEVHQRFRVEIHHRSRRLSDPTGRSHKAALDGLVRGGLLGDDSLEWIEEIRETYKQAAVDETIIEIWEVT